MKVTKTLGVERDIFENAGIATQAQLLNAAGMVLFRLDDLFVKDLPIKCSDILASIDGIDEMIPGEMLFQKKFQSPNTYSLIER